MLGFFKKKAEPMHGLSTTAEVQKGRGAPKFQPLNVSEVRRETSDSVSVAFALPEELHELFRFRAGQYLTFRTTIDGTEVRRSYSLCSSPLSGELRVAIKQVENGVFSTWANTVLTAGTTLETMPPQGGFVFDPDATRTAHYAGFAAGSGITPVLSILTTVLEAEPTSTFALYYGNRSTASILFKQELEDLKDRYLGRLEVHHVLSREDQGADALKGRIDRDRVELFAERFPALTSARAFYLCGPEPMIHGVTDALVGLGVPKERVHFELFTAATPGAAPAKSASGKLDKGATVQATVILDREETHFNMRPKDFLLDAALDAGADVPYACKGAVCCTCRAKVLEGSVEMAMNYALSEEEVADGYVLTCQATPTSEKVVVSFDE